MQILSVFGTRPEAIKLAPVIRELRRHPDRAVCKVCVTTQHCRRERGGQGGKVARGQSWSETFAQRELPEFVGLHKVVF